MTTQPVQPEKNMPDGVYSNPKPATTKQATFSRDDVGNLMSMFTAVEPPDNSADMKELLGMGDPEAPWESFTRAEIPNMQQVTYQARAFTKQLPLMRGIGAWDRSPMANLPLASSYLITFNMLSVSHQRKGRKEAVMVGAGVYAPGYDRQNRRRREE